MMCAAIPRLVTVMLLCLPLLLDVSNGQLESMMDKRSGDKYCGRKLVGALQLVCNGVYNSPPLTKKANGDLIPAEYPRGAGGSFWMRGGGDADDDLALPPLPPLSRSKAGDAIFFRRVTRGVYDECCRNSCTLHQLQMYCARR